CAVQMYPQAIVRGDAVVAAHIIAAEVEATMGSFWLGILSIVGIRLQQPAAVGGGGAWLVVVVHDVIASPFSAVSIVGPPVVEQVVAEINALPVGFVAVAAATEAGCAAVVVYQEVAEEGSVHSTPDAAVAV